MSLTSGVKRIASSASAFALSFAIALWPAPAAAQASRDTLRWMQQYYNDLSALYSVANGVPGPYTVGGSCSWCTSRPIWAFGKCMETKGENWSQTIEFRSHREELMRAVAQARQSLDTVRPSYALVQEWVNGLGAFSQAFDANADRIIAVQDEIRAGKGPTEAQRQIVAAALRKLTDDVAKSSTRLRAVTSPIATALQQQSALRVQIRQELEKANITSRASFAKAQKEADAHTCKAGIPEGFAAIRTQVDRASYELTNTFARLESPSRESEKALAALLGFVIDSQTDLKTVEDLLAATANDKLGSFLERLHISAAKKQWRELAMRGG